jgi:2'-5' RNA ligase
MRAFLGIPLSAEVQAAACASREILAASGEGWRFVRDDGLHITMRFLGEVDASRRDAVGTACLQATSIEGRPELRLIGAAVVPSRRRPRILWLGVVDESQGRLAGLAGRLETALIRLGFPPEERPFSPHVTLARARRGTRVAIPPVEQVGDLGSFVADRLVLYRSELLPGGSVYHEEASYPLGTGDVT